MGVKIDFFPNNSDYVSRSHACCGICLWALASADADDRVVTLNGRDTGRVFEGLGALSAGASSRLLIDYPEPWRSEVLDLLFKPNYGASLQHLKVEVGGDVNSTDGTEPSIARTAEEFLNPKPEYFKRGYEWWLMKEAQRRNPKIILDCLPWGAPGWIGPGRFYSPDMAEYTVKFLQGAKRAHGLDIKYCGVWNETPYDAEWVKLLRHTLDAHGLQRVQIVGADQCQNQWGIAAQMQKDPKLMEAVAVIGEHYPAFHTTTEAQRTGKRLWSEDGPWRGDWDGACALAKIYNRNYMLGRMTKTTTRSPITSYYENLPLPNSGPMKANTPWSGHYEIQPALWAIAHTTQFATDWLLDGSCVPLDNGSVVALASPDRHDFSLIIESVGVRQPQTLRFQWLVACRQSRCTSGAATRNNSSSIPALLHRPTTRSISPWTPVASIHLRPRPGSAKAILLPFRQQNRSRCRTKMASIQPNRERCPGISPTKAASSRSPDAPTARETASGSSCLCEASIGSGTLPLSRTR